jgi:uncharacterized membrane protein (DUF2068 family)
MPGDSSHLHEAPLSRPGGAKGGTRQGPDAGPESEVGTPCKRAPTLYAIIAFKLMKGSLFVALAIVLYCLSDNNLPEEYRDFLDRPLVQKVLHALRVHPGNKFFTDLAVKIGELTEANVLWAAAGTLVYSLFSFVEGFGLIARVSWACWMAIGESAFFVPIEFYELVRRPRFSWSIFFVMLINVLIVWYLAKNRQRLFQHHHDRDSRVA